MFDFSSQVSQIGGWLAKSEGTFLYTLAQQVRRHHAIVEIGSWKGRSTICLASGSRDGNSAKVYAVDPHTQSFEHKKLRISHTYAEFLHNTSALTHFITPLVTTSFAASQKFNRPVGLLFIDGSHTYQSVSSDFSFWFSKVVPGGTIVFHDSWQTGVHPFTALLLATSPYIAHPKLVDTLTAITKVDQVSFFDRLTNLTFILYRLLVGWRGVIAVDRTAIET